MRFLVLSFNQSLSASQSVSVLARRINVRSPASSEIHQHFVTQPKLYANNMQSLHNFDKQTFVR
ncbi:hypothetical protein BB562_10340 [Lactiplantibacillus pentosus]|nr:hypothetical protein BB562_10340 [Lactiplantibacillus pentosus]MCT3276749.1 hypothetical protein [Lactiplantibacillus pentosus]